MKKTNPPGWATNFFRWFADADHFEELQGDLEENFNTEVKITGIRKAKWNYVIEILRLVRPSVWDTSAFKSQNSNYMLRNYTKIAWRNLGKQKLFSFINLFGLAISLSVCLLIVSIIVDQLSFDKFHKNYNSIYRIITYNKDLRYGWDEYLATTSLPLYENLKGNSEIENLVRIRRNFWGDVETGEKTIPLSGHMADKDFFKLFSFELIKGNPDKVLESPFTIVLTKSSKEKLFGNEEAIGKTVKVGRFGDYIVTGIMKDPPRTSHMQFEMLGSFASLEGLKEGGIYSGYDNWLNFTGYYIYFSLPDTEDVAALENLIHRLGAVESENLNNRILDFELQSLSSITPGKDLANQIGPSFGKSELWYLMILAFVILLLACFNYVNLTLAKSLKRFKEVGIRKAMGGQKRQLMIQFVYESTILALLSVIPAVLLMVALKPQFFSTMSAQKARFLTFDLSTEIGIAIICFAILTGILAGIVPAIILSGIKASATLKDKSIKLFTGVSLRKSLVVAQFGIALFFLTLTTMGYKYYSYQLNFDLGYVYGEIYNIELQGTDPEIFKAEFNQIPEVQNISFSTYILSTDTKMSNYVISKDKKDTLIAVNVAVYGDFLQNHHFELLAGNSFSDFALGNDTRIIVNEKLVKALGLVTEEAIDYPLWVQGPQSVSQMTIAGVVKDFYHSKSSQPIEPFYFTYNPERVYYGNLKLVSNNLPGTVSKLKAAWKRVDNDVHTYKGEFYSQQIENSISELKALIKLVGFSASLTICISLLGILGMVVFTCETRVKEIGIRKVLGASISTLIVTISKGYAAILLTAATISTSLVYLFYDKIISPEIYNKPEYSWLDYLSGVLIVFGIGMLIIIGNGYLTARRNPVVSLKEE